MDSTTGRKENPMNLYGADLDRTGTCTRCGAEAAVVNGVAMHEDGWRDDECSPSAAEVR